MAWTELDGLRVHYRHYPATQAKAARLLMLHMAGSSSVAWSAVARRLAGRIDVYVPDLPGHGQSEGEPLDSVAAMAAFAQNFADALGFDRFYLAGHSMGGAVALQLALDLHVREHDRLLGLILVATGARLPVAQQIFERIDDPQALAAMIAGPGLRAQGLSAQVEVIFPQTTAQGLRRDFAACSIYDLSAQLAQIKVRALVLAGRQDIVTPVALARELAQGLPLAELQIFDQVGHMLPRQAAQQLTCAVQKFIG